MLVNEHRAMKHFIIAARAGFKLSLDRVREGYMNGTVTKEHFTCLPKYARRNEK